METEGKYDKVEEISCGYHYCHFCFIIQTIIETDKFQTKQTKPYVNRIAPCFPDARGLLASDIRDWLDRP